MRVTWTCWLHPYSSMGIIAINVIRELTRLGIDIGLNVLNEVNPQEYPKEVQEALKKGYREDSIGIFFSYPDSFPSVRCKINIGYTGADSSGWYHTENQISPADSCNKFMDYMLTPSKYSKEIMEECGVKTPIEIFPHGVDSSIFRPVEIRREEPFTFLYIGELSLRKGTQDLIESFGGLYGNDSKFKLVLRANEHMAYYNGNEIKNLCSKYNNIDLKWENSTQEELYKYYSDANVYVYPSRADWFGMTVFEAMACGLPVIATDTNGYKDFLNNRFFKIEYSKELISTQHPYLKGTWNVVYKQSLKDWMRFVETNYFDIQESRLYNSKFIEEKFSWEEVVKTSLLPFLRKIDRKESQIMDRELGRVTIGIPTKDRLLELSILLQSLLFQTYQDFDILIIDDCSSKDFFQSNTTLRSLLQLLRDSGHEVNIIRGEQRGPHIAGQKILENAKTELILRLDDDVSLRPEFIQNLVKHFEDSNIGAVGPIYLNPHEPISNQIMSEEFNQEVMKKLGKVYWDENDTLFLTGFLQSKIHNSDNSIEIQHLNSGFMYRKTAGIKIGGYFLGFSKVGHREESDFSYRIFREGYKLLIDPNSIALHFHPMIGGIRETNGVMLSKSNWDHDEKLFLERVEGWLPKSNANIYNKFVSVIILTHGDHQNLRELLIGIFNYTNHPLEIIVINNDTSNESRSDCQKILFEEFKDKKIIRMFNLNKEVSVSEARNRGVENINPESKYICFIDDDARILGRYNQTTDWLDYLYNRFHEKPDIGAVGPIYTWYDLLKTYTISVACLFTSKKVWDIIGGFDSVFGNKEKGTWGYEDVDWSYRCFSNGFKLLGVKGLEFPLFHADTTFKEKSEWQDTGLVKALDLLKNKYDFDEINKFPNRTIYPLTPQQMDIHGIKLNIGCYYMQLEDFINIDIKDNIGADLVCNALDVEKHFRPNSVDLILSSHMLEHLNIFDGKKVLKSWFNLLKPGGMLTIEVPDCENIDEKLNKGEIDQDLYSTCKFGCPQEFGQKHEAEYTRDRLKNILQESGFHNIIENHETSLGSNFNKGAYAFRYDCIKG